MIVRRLGDLLVVRQALDVCADKNHGVSCKRSTNGTDDRNHRTSFRFPTTEWRVNVSRQALGLLLTVIARFGSFSLLLNTAAAVQLTEVGDSWQRESAPNVAFTSDLISVWSTNSNDSPTARSGLVEFDLSGIAAPITEAHLQLWSPSTSFTDNPKSINQTAVLLDAATFAGIGDAASWNQVQAALDTSLETLGAYDLSGPFEKNRFYSSDASAADAAALEAIRLSANPTAYVAMFAVEDGNEYATSWGDGEFLGNQATLFINEPFDPPDPPPTNITVELYAEVNGPNELAFDAAGNLYVGSAASFDFIKRIGPGGGSVETYGNAGIFDPDSVLVDTAGTISGTPGSILVGGEGTSAVISAILPNESVITIFNLPKFSNPLAMTFDSTGRLVFGAGYPNGNVWTSSGAQPTVLYSATPVIQSLEIDALDRIFTTNNTGTMQIHSDTGALIDGNFVNGLGSSTQIEFGPGGDWGTDLYALSNGELLRIDDLGNSVVVGTGFENFVNDMEFGPDGALYISDYLNDRILRVEIVPEPSTLGLALMMLAPWGLIRRRYVR